MGLALSGSRVYDGGMTITNNNTAPVYGTTTATWEGYVRVDEIIPGDLVVPNGIVESAVRQTDDIIVLITNGREMEYLDDEMLYIERTVKVTIEEV